MVVTRRGADGVCVASHVTEEIRLALVHVPIPRQHTEDEAAGDWDQLLKHKDVTRTNVPPAVSSLAQHKSHDTQPMNRFPFGVKGEKLRVRKHFTTRASGEGFRELQIFTIS